MREHVLVSKVILVVDDDPDAAETFAELLKELGHHAEFVTDPREVLDATRHLRPELIFLDISMPYVNGWELARALRQDLGDDALRLVAVTGAGEEEDHRRSRESGFDAHVRKPVDVHLLQSILKQVT